MVVSCVGRPLAGEGTSKSYRSRAKLGVALVRLKCSPNLLGGTKLRGRSAGMLVVVCLLLGVTAPVFGNTNGKRESPEVGLYN